MAQASFQDHYELLQLSINADPDTIHRVYRLLAQRFHPDNKDTGNAERFQDVREAYRILSDPELRAQYDVSYHRKRGDRWRVFGEEAEAAPADPLEFEKRVRAGVLGLLYTRRRNEPYRPEMTLHDLEELLGIPREHLEFSLWFLRERNLIKTSDSGELAITADGVEYAEQVGVGRVLQKQLAQTSATRKP